MALFKRYVQNVADAILHVADSVDNPIDYDNQSKGGYVHQTDGPSGFITDKFEIRIDEFN